MQETLYADRCAIAVMAKLPRWGRVKTRLVPPLRPEEATALSVSFLRDVTENLALASQAMPIDPYVAYAPAGSAPLFAGVICEGTRLILADGSDGAAPDVEGLGRSLLHALRSLLDTGYGSACLLNSDSPTLPTAVLTRAAEMLATARDQIILGPADDGGYYLIGARSPHPELFANIAWSTATVAEETRARARALDLDVVELPIWYDVDDGAALARLLREIDGADVAAGLTPYPASATAARLKELELRERLSSFTPR